MDDVRVLFLDIDDTLYDYRGSLAEHVERLRAEFPALGRFDRDDFLALYWKGYGSVPHEEKVRLLRRDVDAYRRRIWDAVFACADGECPDVDAVARRFGELRDTRLPPHPGLLDFLDRARGRYDVGVISNGPGELQRRKLRALRVHEHVRPDLVFISHEVGWDKPDERIFRRALDAAGAAAEHCLMIGDDPVNDLGAKRVGMRFALFCGRGDVPATEHAPDAVVRGFDELAAVLKVK